MRKIIEIFSEIREPVVKTVELRRRNRGLRLCIQLLPHFDVIMEWNDFRRYIITKFSLLVAQLFSERESLTSYRSLKSSSFSSSHLVANSYPRRVFLVFFVLNSLVLMYEKPIYPADSITVDFYKAHFFLGSRSIEREVTFMLIRT